jgi:hypothetical protein
MPPAIKVPPESEHPVDARRVPHGNPVAGAHSALAEPAGDACCPVPQLPVGEPLAAELGERLGIGRAVGPTLQ